MGQVIITKDDIVDWDDIQDELELVDNTLGNEVLAITTKNALRAFLVFVGVAWDVTLDPFVTWRVKKDGAVINQLKDSRVQIAPPEQPDQELSPWLELPQQCTVSLEMDLVGAGTNGNGTGRFRILYAKVDSGLYLPRQ